MLTGGGALLSGLDKLIYEETGMHGIGCRKSTDVLH